MGCTQKTSIFVSLKSGQKPYLLLNEVTGTFPFARSLKTRNLSITSRVQDCCDVGKVPTLVVAGLLPQ